MLIIACMDTKENKYTGLLVILFISLPEKQGT
jgi:hypothetical protein